MFHSDTTDPFHSDPFHYKRFGLLSGETGNFRLVITADLMRFYRDAFDFRKANREGFDKLDAFLPKEGNGALAISGSSGSDLVWTPHSSRMTDELLERFLADAKQSRLRRPSLLEFYKIDKNAKTFGLPGLPDGSLVGVAMQVEVENIPKQPVALVYVDGRWKIGVVSPGT